MTTTAATAAVGTMQDDVDIVIDNPEAEVSGTWSASTYQRAYYGANYIVTNRNASSQDPRVVRWRPELPGPGQHTVSVWLPDGGADRSDAVTYRVRHDGGESTFVLDQTVSGGYWRQLGRGPMTFSGSGEEYVELRVADVQSGPGNAPTYVQADAIRFATPPPALTSAPSSVEVAVARNYAELSWQPLEGATTYIVNRALAGRQPQEVAEVTGTAYLDLSLDLHQTYTFTVAGVNGAGVGPASAQVQAMYAAGTPLEAVQGLTLSTQGAKALLAWEPSTDATTYQIERSPKSGTPGKAIATVDGTSYTDTPPGDQAYYVVRSVNVHGAAALGSWQLAWLRE